MTQCRPLGLFELLHSLNDKQKEDVVSIGFGGLLKLNLSKCFSQDMLKWLVEQFNGSSRMLSVDDFRQFPVTADDVYDVFMIPRNDGRNVVCYSRSDDTSVFESFSKKYGIAAKTPIRFLASLIVEKLSEGGDDFKRAFVLFCLCSFLCPSSNRSVSTIYFKSLEVVEDIHKLDWCNFVLKKLSDSVLAYQNDGVKNVSGCVLVLQILYLHRLKWRGVCEPCSIPLIQHWNDEKMKKRCYQEVSAGVFGSGDMVGGVYPVSVNGVLKSTISGKESGDNEYQVYYVLLIIP